MKMSGSVCVIHNCAVFSLYLMLWDNNQDFGSSGYSFWMQLFSRKRQFQIPGEQSAAIWTAANFGLPPQKSAGFGHLLWENDKTLRICKKREFSVEIDYFYQLSSRDICWKALLSSWLQGMSLIVIQNLFMSCTNILSFCFYSWKKKKSQDWRLSTWGQLQEYFTEEG